VTAHAPPLAPAVVTVVIPVYNKRALLAESLDSIVAAAEHHRTVEVIAVDNGSTDGSYELLLERYAGRVAVHRFLGRTVAAVRNWGARQGTGRYLCFLDCDVTVPPDFFDHLVETFESGVAEAVGCELGIPAAPHWSERVWWELTVRTDDRYTHYLNSGNFSVTRGVFDRVGGFPEELETAEDTEICRRLRATGARIYQTQALAGVHLGNPKSVRGFFRRLRWHGLGISDGKHVRLTDRATIMMLTNATLVASAAVVLGGLSSLPLLARAFAATACVLAVPVVTYVFRARQVRRLPNPLLALALIEVLYAARFSAFVTVVWRVTLARLGSRLMLRDGAIGGS
jgi:hypothetical protein